VLVSLKHCGHTTKSFWGGFHEHVDVHALFFFIDFSGGGCGLSYHMGFPHQSVGFVDCLVMPFIRFAPTDVVNAKLRVHV
jgi:hypothetical protein